MVVTSIGSGARMPGLYPAYPLTHWVTVGKLLNLSVRTDLYSNDGHNTYLHGCPNSEMSNMCVVFAIVPTHKACCLGV